MRRWTSPGSRVVVAVSGGPDSQTLLHCLAGLRQELGIDLVAVGIDHRLRPEAAAELETARALAREHRVPFEAVAVHVENGDNVMAAARRARYRALRAAARRHEASAIALAHTASDQVENVLLNLSRGAGLRGVRGMPARRGSIVRPLLGTSRDEIHAYLAAHDVAFATDPSNADRARARGQLRHAVIPGLRAINPALEAAVARFTRSAREDEALLRTLAHQELEARLGLLGSLSVAGIERVPAPVALRMLAIWLHRWGMRSNQRGLRELLAISCAGSGGRSVSGVNVRVEGGRLWRISSEERVDEPLAPTQAVRVESLDICVRSELVEPPEPISATRIAAFQHRRADNVAFDWDSLHLGIRVRSWTEGDRFEPFGLDGHTKIGDLFTDRKIPRVLRAIWPLVVHGNEVLWVVGLRRGSGAPVRVGSQRILNLTVEGMAPQW
jgi:tRNA(Ile)-lysidine synthase